MPRQKKIASANHLMPPPPLYLHLLNLRDGDKKAVAFRFSRGGVLDFL